MVAYAWTCHACGSGNLAGTDHCVACGCAATASRVSLERDLPELQARNPQARLEPQLHAALVLANLLTWAFTFIGLVVWFVASESSVSYGGLGLVIAAWLLRKFIPRSVNVDARN